MHWRKISLVGIGLLGGSLGLAVRQRRLAGRVEGFVRRQASVRECESLGVADQISLDLAVAVRDADLIILCTPLAQMRGLAEQMLPSLSAGALVTDVGSVKAGVVAELEPLLARAGAYFIGSHPMAGAERVGVANARADLFAGAVCVLTPTSRSQPELVRKLGSFWEGVGAAPMQLPPALHDELVSRSSHLPHVVAAELANYVLNPDHAKEQALLCAGGFRDTTRIASGSPEMWRDICLANGPNLARALGGFMEGLQELRRALEMRDGAALEQFFVQAKQRRDAWQAPADSRSPE